MILLSCNNLHQQNSNNSFIQYDINDNRFNSIINNSINILLKIIFKY